MSSQSELQERWRYLYQEYLPTLAKANDSAQKQWPVHLDHCFARIVLDNAIGIDKPWMEVIQQPAIKNMTMTQLETAIQLAENIATGEEELKALDDRSLQLRGKSKKRKAGDDIATTEAPKKPKKPKKSEPTVSSYFLPSPTSPSKNATKDDTDHTESTTKVPGTKEPHSVDILAQIKRIQDSNITSFRKQTLTLLCQIPRARYSTYGAISDWISANSHRTCARAVGNAMRNNPFAPEVPCHRVLSGDGTIGGFKGSWGEGGMYAKQKHDLLREEGVRFDSKGKVKGPPFREFSI